MAPTTRREQKLAQDLEGYLNKVKALEDEKKDAQAQIRELRAEKRELQTQLDAKAVQEGRATRNGGAGASGSAAEVRKLQEEKKALESKVKAALADNKKLRDEFNDSFEDARNRFRTQGVIHGNQRAAKAADQSAAQITYLKDTVDRLEKANKSLDAELKRLKKDARQATVSEAEVAELRERTVALERNVETLQNEKENLERELEYQEERQSLSQERPPPHTAQQVADLQGQVEDLRGELERVEREKKRAEASMRKLKEELRQEKEKEKEKEKGGAGQYDGSDERVQELTALLEASVAQEKALEQQVVKLGTRVQGFEKREDEWELLSNEVLDLRVIKARAEEQEKELERLRAKAGGGTTPHARAQEEEAKRLRTEVAALKRRLTEADATKDAAETQARHLDKRVEELAKENARLAREADGLAAAQALLLDDQQTLTDMRDTGRLEVQALTKEKAALEQRVTRLEAEVEEAEAKVAQAAVQVAAAAAAAAAAPSKSASKPSPSPARAAAVDGGDVRHLQEENAGLKREMEMYRHLAASQDQQFSLVYIQEVNTQADYLVVENRTNMDISLAGWALGAVLSEGEIQYELPEDMMLSAHAHVKVWWGTKNLQHKLWPTRGNLFWEESDRFDIFRPQDDQVVLTDPEGYEMSRMKVISGKRRARAGPHGGTPSPDAKKPRHYFTGAAGSAGEIGKAVRRTPFY